MDEIRIKVPEGYGDLLADEVVQRGTIRSLAKQRLRELRADRNEARQRIEEFEERYDLSFEEFETRLPDDREAHEDYNEWYFWVQTERRISDRIESVRSID